jgi:hypothetical protein
MNMDSTTEIFESPSVDNIQVCVRVRPISQRENLEGNKPCVEVDDNQLRISKADGSHKAFKFDKVYDPALSQEDIFKRMGQKMVEGFLNGYNSTIFAYGQTGAGKTFTMVGELEINDLWGLQPRCLEYIFYLLNEKPKDYILKVSFVEIYNEKIIDLLGDKEEIGKYINIREDLKKGIYMEGVREEQISTFSEAIQLMIRGNTMRHVSGTNMNANSSRSHSIFSISYQSCEVKQECSSFKKSVFNFVDLAGSERQKSTQATGDRFKEGCNINRSLTVLGSVINALADKGRNSKQNFVRYRDSKLTFLLKNSLGGNSKTCFIANIAPASSYYMESLSTLMFAQRAKCVRNAAKINENLISDSIRALTAELNKTKAELNTLSEKYSLLQQSQLVYKQDLVCTFCSNKGREMKTKLSQRNAILTESLSLLRKCLEKWEIQARMFSQSKKTTADSEFFGTLMAEESLSPDRKRLTKDSDFAEINQIASKYNTLIKTHAKNKVFPDQNSNDSNKMELELNLSNRKSRDHSKSNNKGSLCRSNSGPKNDDAADLDPQSITQFRNTSKYLKDIAFKLKQMILLLRIEIIDLKENKTGLDESEVPNLDSILAHLSYFKHENIDLQRQLDSSAKDFSRIKSALATFTASGRTMEQPMTDNTAYKYQKYSPMNRKVSYAEAIELLETEQKIKHDRLLIEVEQLRETIASLKDENNRLKQDQSNLITRNKALKAWNDETVEEKSKLTEQMEKIKYEKFSLLRKIDEDFEQTRLRNEQLFNDWEAAEREKEILSEGMSALRMENDKLRDGHWRINEKNRILEKENSDYAHREVENKELIGSLYQRVAMLEDQNAELSSSLEHTKARLNETIDELDSTKKTWGATIEEQKAKIATLSEINMLHEKQIAEFNSEVKDLTEQNIQYKTNSENFTRSQNRALERMKKLKDTKDTLYKKYLQLQAQSHQFFNALITIRDKLDSKTATVFEDFIVASEIKLNNDKLKESLRQKEKQIKGLRSHLDQLINDKQSQINSLKSCLDKLQRECVFMSKAFEFKEEEIGVYKRAIRQKSIDHSDILKELTNHVIIDGEESKENTNTENMEILKHENQLLRQKILWLSGFSRETAVALDESPKRTRHINTIGKENVCKKIKFI